MKLQRRRSKLRRVVVHTYRIMTIISLNKALLASDMLYNITFNNVVVIQVLQVSAPLLSLYITYRTFSK